jgi:hypothetical protein
MQTFVNGGKNNINPTRGDFPRSHGDTWKKLLTLEAFLDQANNPKLMSLEDIDASFKEWVECNLEITYAGQVIPTQFLLSIQRLSEFGKNWKITNSEGELILSFKTISRELAPKQGTMYDKIYNIPGEPTWPVCYIPVIENGIEGYDVISMKQPNQVDLDYTVSIFSTKMDTVNKFNTMVIDRFKSLQAYLRVRDTYYVSMTLESVDDETKTEIEERRYYVQNYKILVRAYILQESDFKRERFQNRVLVSVDTEAKYKPCATIMEDDCCPGAIVLTIDFPPGSRSYAKFRIDENVHIKSVSNDNIRSFTLKRNDETVYNACVGGFDLRENDRIEIHFKKWDNYLPAKIRFSGQIVCCEMPKSVFDCIIPEIDTDEIFFDNVEPCEVPVIDSNEISFEYQKGVSDNSLSTP